MWGCALEHPNCIKALSGTPDELVGEQCAELDGEDTALADWRSTEQSEQTGLLLHITGQEDTCIQLTLLLPRRYYNRCQTIQVPDRSI